MDEKKQEDTGVTTDTTPETMTGDLSGTAMNSVSESTTDSSSAPTMEASATNSSDETVTSKTGLGAFNVRAYVLAVAAILLICAGLLFVLEKEGRISTGLFSSVIDKMEASAPAARVNGVVITGAEFSSSLEQLTDLSATQGANIADANVLAQLRTQAIETLINAELLRQAAIAEGITVTPEEIEGRFNEIRDGIGGAEVLATRMAEFGVTEESLRKDIENEFHFNTAISALMELANEIGRFDTVGQPDEEEERTYRGLHSRGYKRDYLAWQERRVRYFHENIDRWIAD